MCTNKWSALVRHRDRCKWWARFGDRATRCNDRVKRCFSPAPASGYKTRGIRSREFCTRESSLCPRGLRCEQRASDIPKVNSGESIRCPGVLVRKASSEVSATSGCAIDERDNHEEIADDERNRTLLYV